ncbi:MAG: AraC family transcriptional regulator [Enhydrobacter sp.]|nr:AraC family transcriptional regulator [Enhydrobacter sp.]
MAGLIHDLTGFPVLPDGMLRVAPLSGLPAALASLGVTLDPLLEEVGLPYGIMDDADTQIGIAQAGRLLSLSAERAACPQIGLLIGRSTGLGTLGPIGELARDARDVGTALRGLILALHMHDGATVPTLAERQGVAALSTVALGDLREGAAEISDLTMYACFNILRELCGAMWQPLNVGLSRRSPPDRRPYVQAFGAAVHFDAEYNTLTFNADWLKRPMRLRAKPQPDLLLRAAGRHPLDAAGQIRRACVQAIMEGKPTVERLAELVRLSRRTLNRRLALNGTTARAELLRVRVRIARQLLAGTGLPLADIADLLGYADTPAFTRAFRNEIDAAPAAWRLSGKSAA